MILSRKKCKSAIAAYAELAELSADTAIAHFLDPDSMRFDDCQIGLQKERLELLKLEKRDLQIGYLTGDFL